MKLLRQPNSFRYSTGWYNSNQAHGNQFEVPWELHLRVLMYDKLHLVLGS